jgi:hypothetical protein
VTLNGGTLDTCTLANFTTATSLVTTPAGMTNVNDCSFVSDGSNHAVDLGTVSSTTSFNWNNFATGYVAGTTGSPVSTGSTGNETITVNVASGQALTINVGAGYTIPSVRNTGSGTVNVVAGQVTTTIKAVDSVTGSNVQNARVYLIAGSGGPLTAGTVIFNTLTDSNGEVQDIRSLSNPQPVEGWVRKGTSSIYYKTAPISATISNSSGLDLTIQLIRDE